jgi:hypothetical protein
MESQPHFTKSNASDERVTVRYTLTYEDWEDAVRSDARRGGPLPPTGGFGRLVGRGLYALSRAHDVTISDAGIFIGNGDSPDHPWEKWYEHYETPVSVVLTRVPDVPFVIPKRAMTADQLDVVRRIVARHVSAS